MDLQPELFHLPESKYPRPLKWLQSAEGTVFSLSPYTTALPPQTGEMLKLARAMPVEPNIDQGIVILSRAAQPESFRFWCLINEDTLQRMARICRVTLDRRASLLSQLLQLREVVWAQKYPVLLNQRAQRPCTPGEVLGWLNYQDRCLLIRRALARLDYRRFRALFYAYPPEEKPHTQAPRFSPRPDPTTSFPLLMDCCPPLVRSGWKYWRLGDTDLADSLNQRHRDFWYDLFRSPRWSDGFSPEGAEILRTLACRPLEIDYRRKAAELAVDTAVLRKAAVKFGVLRGFSLTWEFSWREISLIFWRQPGWQYFRAAVTRRTERLIREEFAYLDSLDSRGEIDWRKVYEARRKWRQFLKYMEVVYLLENT